MGSAVVVAVASAASVPLVNKGPQAGPLTPLYNGDLIQTPKGLRSLALEGFSEDLDQDGYVDPVAHAVAAPVQVPAYNTAVYANAVAAAPAAVANAAYAPAYNQVAYSVAPVVTAARALATPSVVAAPAHIAAPAHVAAATYGYAHGLAHHQVAAAVPAAHVASVAAPVARVAGSACFNHVGSAVPC